MEWGLSYVKLRPNRIDRVIFFLNVKLSLNTITAGRTPRMILAIIFTTVLSACLANT